MLFNNKQNMKRIIWKKKKRTLLNDDYRFIEMRFFFMYINKKWIQIIDYDQNTHTGNEEELNILNQM